MVKMHSLRKTRDDKKAEKATGAEAMPYADSDGEMTIHLDHHHLKKMDLADGSLKAGHKVHFAGEGIVEHSSSDKDADGKERHSARLRLHKAGMDHESSDKDGDKRADIRKDVAKAAEKY